MRIIGGRDYYDSAAAYGVDPGIVFVRKPVTLTNGDVKRLSIGEVKRISIMLAKDSEEKWGSSVTDNGKLGSEYLHIRYHPVIFCGKLYTGVSIEFHRINDYQNVTQNFFWSQDKLDAFLEEKGWKLESRTLSYRNNRASLSLFEAFEFTGDALNALLELNVAVACCKSYSARDHLSNWREGRTGWIDENSNWIINGDMLKDVEFQRLFNPVDAFQQLAQWVGGALASYGPEIVEITDDKVKLAKHGMDNWSFRKHKLDK